MITLDLNYAYLAGRYNISLIRLEQYKKRNMSLEEIAIAEAQQGNMLAANLLAELTSNPEKLGEVFQLINPVNRYLILSNMNQQDLLMIIGYLKTEEMILGLSIFNADVLLNLMLKIEPEALARVVLAKMDAEKFMQLIPEEFLNEFLCSDEIDRDMLMQAMMLIDEEQLQKMMEAYTGETCYSSREDILMQLGQLDDDGFMNAVLMFEPEGKQAVILNMLQTKPELFQEFSPQAMVHPFRTMKKEDVLMSLMVLETKEMLPMVEDMPEGILSLIASQINYRVFSQILCSEFADVIAHCGIKM